MKILLFFISILFSFTVLMAQRFTVDSTFQSQLNLASSGIKSEILDVEELASSNVLFTGLFKDSLPNGQKAFGIAKYNIKGKLTSDFSFQGSISNRYLDRINDNSFYIFDNFIDSSGQEKSNSQQWINNVSNTLTGRIHGNFSFFNDGSSLFFNHVHVNSYHLGNIVSGTNTLPAKMIIKLDSNGLYDSTFTGDSYWTVSGFENYNDSMILLYGAPSRLTFYNNVRVDGLCRVNKNTGKLDTSFHSIISTTSSNSNSFAAITLDNSGKFFIHGNFQIKGYSNQEFTIVRCNQDGSLDTSFNLLGAQDSSNAQGAALVVTAVKTNDNGYLIGGLFNKYQNHLRRGIVKVDSSGVIEPQYFVNGPDSSLLNPTNTRHGYAYVNKIIKSNKGGYYIAGNFTYWDGKPVQPLVRLFDNNISVGVNTEINKSREALVIYPNPAKNYLTIQVPKKLQTVGNSITITDLRGKVLLQKRIAQPNKQIPISTLSKGIYLLKLLKNGLPLSTELFIKQ